MDMHKHEQMMQSWLFICNLDIQKIQEDEF